MTRISVVAAACILATASGAAAQTFATGAMFQGYSLDDALGVRSANLFIVPVAFRSAIGSAVAVDVYSAWARGAINVAGTEYTLEGPVDTRVRASWTVAPWIVVTAGVNVPTGASEHDGEQALVASMLSTELLGFREAGWGVGLGATTGIATAHRFGEWGMGFGVSYRHAADYTPAAGGELQYNPGDEVRIRLALDRDIGASKLTAGFTFQNFAQDRIGGRNLFQPGSRLRGDVSYAFRAGALGALTAYGAAAWRERGDVLFDLTTGQPSSGTVGGQVLAVAGVSGQIAATSSLLLYPAVDVRWIDRDDPGGDGWLAGGGFDVPLRAGGVELLPGGRIRAGQLTSRQGTVRSVYGGEVGVTVRFGR
jgi:hypothetical protein